jgi:hypothetical protein
MREAERTDLCGGRPVMGFPTATEYPLTDPRQFDILQYGPGWQRSDQLGRRNFRHRRSSRRSVGKSAVACDHNCRAYLSVALYLILVGLMGLNAIHPFIR